MPNTEITDDYIKNAILSTTSTGAYLIKIIQDNNVCAILQGHNVSENYRFYVAFSYYNIGYVNKIKTFKLRLEEWTIETYITNTDLHKVTHKKNFGGFSANSMREFLIAVINKVLENNLWTSPEDVIVFCATWFGNSYGMGILASQNNNNDIIISYDSEDGNSYTMHYVPSTNTVKTLYKRQGTSLL